MSSTDDDHATVSVLLVMGVVLAGVAWCCVSKPRLFGRARSATGEYSKMQTLRMDPIWEASSRLLLADEEANAGDVEQPILLRDD